MPCALTIPSVVRGINFSIEAVSSTRGRGYVFVSGDKRLYAELLIKPAPASL
jgi:chemotaxis protein CheX